MACIGKFIKKIELKKKPTMPVIPRQSARKAALEERANILHLVGLFGTTMMAKSYKSV